MSRLLLISNGHGEDLSGSLLGVELKRQGHNVDAFPLVGKGKEYKKAGIKVPDFLREFSTGGLGYTSFRGRLTELIEGQVIYLFKTLIRLLFITRKYELLIVIGDVIPVFAAWISCKKTIVYLVAYSSYYEGKLRLPWPASYCLKSKRFIEVFSRDQLTADDLTYQLNRSVSFLGNPFMDNVFFTKKEFEKKFFRLGLLPGSRRPELDKNVLMILRVLLYFPNQILLNEHVSFDMALIDSLGFEELLKLISNEGWVLLHGSRNSQSIVFKNGSCTLNIHRDLFVEVLQSSDALLCMAGTAAEQAIGLSKPVIQLPGNGPQFTSSFAEAQRRLLGPTVFCAKNNLNSSSNIYLETSDLILEVLDRIKNDSSFSNLCLKEASLRIGLKGGTQRIVQSINSFLN